MRSMLFVPADSERKLARGLESGADALILDLEDSVAAANRPIARELARRNRIRDGLIYLQITRGTRRRDHAIPTNPPRPTLILTARPIDPKALAKRREAGVAVITPPDERWKS